MALELNGTTGVSLVQDGVVTAADLASGAITSGALPAGSVLQVVHSQLTGIISTSSTTLSSTGLTVSITPSSTSSKVLLLASLNGSTQTDNTSCLRIELGKNGSSYSYWHSFFGKETNYGNDCSLQYLDSPNTTSAISYEVLWARVGVAGTMYLNDYTGANNRTFSSIVAMEIAG